MQNYSRFRAASVFEDCSREVYICDEARPTTHADTPSSFEGVSVFDEAVLLLPCWTNNHCSRPGLNVVIQTLLALLPTVSIDKAFLVIGMQFLIGKMIKRRHNSITLCSIDRTDYHFCNRWA